MKPPSFAYAAPRSVDEVLTLLAEHGDDARILAGGQSLVPALNNRAVHPALLVDINRVDELSGITETADGLRIGAMTRQATVEDHPLILAHAPLFAAGVSRIGWSQIRARGTVGGSLAQADRHAELPAVALAMGATLHLRSTRGDRTVAIEDWLAGHQRTTRQPDELLVAVEVPREDCATGFQQACRRTSGVGIVTVAARVKDGTARVGIAGVSPRAVLRTMPASDPLDTSGLDPYDDVQGTPAYRLHLARVLTRRAIEEAAA